MKTVGHGYLFRHHSTSPPISLNNIHPAMASAAFPNIEQLVKTIKNDGFIFLEGGGKGLQAMEFQKKQFPITTSEGIDFLEAHTFNDPVRRFNLISSPHLTF